MSSTHHPPPWLDLIASPQRLQRLAQAAEAPMRTANQPLPAIGQLLSKVTQPQILVVHGPPAGQHVSNMALLRWLEQEMHLHGTDTLMQGASLCLQRSIFRTLDAPGLTRILFQLSRYFHLQTPLAMATESRTLRLADMDAVHCHEDLLALLRGLGFNALGLHYATLQALPQTQLETIIYRAREHGFQHIFLAMDRESAHSGNGLAAEIFHAGGVDALWPGPFPTPNWKKCLDEGAYLRNQRGVYWAAKGLECDIDMQLGLGPAAISLAQGLCARNHLDMAAFDQALAADELPIGQLQQEEKRYRQLS